MRVGIIGSGTVGRRGAGSTGNHAEERIRA
jgi:hypothetical protein